MHGNPYGSGLVGDGPGDGLANPPCGIGGKFKALAVVKLFHRLDQSQIPFLNQIQKKHSAAHITLCDTDHQTQVGFRKTLLGFLVPLFHPLCQFDLFLCGKQGNLADLFQVHPHRVLQADAVRNRQIQVLHIHIIFVRQDDIIAYLIIRNPEHIHIVLLQYIQNLLELFLFQRHVREKIIDFLILQHVFLLFGNI